MRKMGVPRFILYVENVKIIQKGMWSGEVINYYAIAAKNIRT